MWRASVLTIFPDMFPGPLAHSLAGKALTSGIWSLDMHPEHRTAQKKAREIYYSEYSIQVCNLVRESRFKRTEEPASA